MLLGSMSAFATHGLAAVNSVPWDTIANYAKPFLNKVVSTTTNIVTRCLNRVCTNYMPYFFTLLLQLCTFTRSTNSRIKASMPTTIAKNTVKSVGKFCLEASFSTCQFRFLQKSLERGV